MPKLKTILNIIPISYRKKLPIFSFLSCINLVLELVSIAYLIPVFLLILDYQSSKEFLSQYIELNYVNIPILITAFIVSFIIKNLIQIRIYKYQSKYIFDVATKLSSNLLDQFLSKRYLDFQKKNTAKSIQNIKIVGFDFSNHILLSLNTFITEGLLVLIIMCVSMYFYLILTCIVMSIMAIVFLILLWLRKNKVSTINSSLSDTYASITSQLLNILQGYVELKSLRKEKMYFDEFSSAVKDFNTHYSNLNVYKQSNSKYLEILLVICLTLMLFFFISSNSTNQANVFLLSFIAGSALKLLPSVNKIINAYTNYEAFKYTINILEDIDIPNQSKSDSPIFTKSLELKEVSFQYNDQVLILNRVNLKINKGDFIGITGNSGNGKTTLLHIMMNLLRPQVGSILIDDVEVLEHQNVFNSIKYLPQNPFIFEGSLLYNIVLDSNPNINYHKIDQLSEILGIQELLQSRQSLLLDINSMELSGGQKQRLALLRTLYHDSDFLVLDEATNQLDETTENNILNYLKTISKYGKTIVFVSHNLKLKNVCDAYYRLDRQMLVKVN